jgi:hypothetical protein
LVYAVSLALADETILLMTSRKAQRREAAKGLDSTMNEVATALTQVNVYVAACAKHGVIEGSARRLVPAIRQLCGPEPMGLAEFQDAVLDLMAWRVTAEEAAAALGVGLQIFCPERVPLEMRAGT